MFFRSLHALRLVEMTKVAALGEDVRKAAEKKFQEINAAKDRIWKARGL